MYIIYNKRFSVLVPFLTVPKRVRLHFTYLMYKPYYQLGVIKTVTKSWKKIRVFVHLSLN